MTRAVLVICDGHRRDLVTPESCPSIHRLRSRGTWFDAHGGVFPSVTRASSASIATGCRPARHGLHGNTMALDIDGHLSLFDVGHPEFRDWLRRSRGWTLHVPTLAERLSERGGAILCSNVSPGAAYMHDPDGFGHVYHRAGSYAPGLVPIEGQDAVSISHDPAGDLALTERFCSDILEQRQPALATLWLANPDQAMHKHGLGSKQHRAALATVDPCGAEVSRAVDRLNANGEDVLLLVGSDHGQETVAGSIALDRILVEAGLKTDLNSADVVVAPQGTSALLYLSDGAQQAGRAEDLAGFLSEQSYVGEIYMGEDLRRVDLVPEGGLVLAVDGRKAGTPNAEGVPGHSDCFVLADSGEEKAGLGQHGGLGRHEQSPFLIALGRGLPVGEEVTQPSSIIDIAPTILRHLDLSWGGLDGRPLQRN